METFSVELTRAEIEALEQQCSVLAHVELDEDRRTEWTGIRHKLCDALKPEAADMDAADGLGADPFER